MILEKEFEGVMGPLRIKLEKQITTSIKQAVGAMKDNRPEAMEHLNLTCLKSIANIKAVLDLARNLQERVPERSK